MTTTISQPEILQSTRSHCSRHPPEGWDAYLLRWGMRGFHHQTSWSRIFQNGLKHQAWYLWTERSGQITGVLPLMHIQSALFGSYLVSQPYLNTGGILADSAQCEEMLIERAVRLADSLDVRRMELRHEESVQHAALNGLSTEKVHMRLRLPTCPDELWGSFKSKVRSQIRKPLNNESLTVQFGGMSELEAFYSVFCHNMRDLGTPPFARSLFEEILQEFPDAAEICTVRAGQTPVASGLLLHGPGTTLIPSASSLRAFNSTSCNMLMYWHAMTRSIERGQSWFDFGRSSSDSGTYRFKKQFGSEEFPASWQYYNRSGSTDDMRPGSGRFDLMIRVWQKLPVWLTRLIGPAIVRGIP